MSAHHSFQGWVEYQTQFEIHCCFIGAAGPIVGAMANARINVYNPAHALFINNQPFTAEVGHGWYYRQMTPNTTGIWTFEAEIVADSVWVSGMFRCTYEGTAI